jgi:hypothetical protein
MQRSLTLNGVKATISIQDTEWVLTLESNNSVASISDLIKDKDERDERDEREEREEREERYYEGEDEGEGDEDEKMNLMKKIFEDNDLVFKKDFMGIYQEWEKPYGNRYIKMCAFVDMLKKSFK